MVSVISDGNLFVGVERGIADKITRYWGLERVVTFNRSLLGRLTVEQSRDIDSLFSRSTSDLCRIHRGFVDSSKRGLWYIWQIKRFFYNLLSFGRVTRLERQRSDLQEIYDVFSREIRVRQQQLRDSLTACVKEDAGEGVEQRLFVVAQECLAKIKSDDTSTLAQRVANYVEAYNQWNLSLVEEWDICCGKSYRNEFMELDPFSSQIVEVLKAGELEWSTKRKQLIRGVYNSVYSACRILCLLTVTKIERLDEQLRKQRKVTDKLPVIVDFVETSVPDNFAKSLFLELFILPDGDEKSWNVVQCRRFMLTFNNYRGKLVSGFQELFEEDIKSIATVYEKVIEESQWDASHDLGGDWENALGALQDVAMAKTADLWALRSALGTFQVTLYHYLKELRQYFDTVRDDADEFICCLNAISYLGDSPIFAIDPFLGRVKSDMLKMKGERSNVARS